MLATEHQINRLKPTNRRPLQPKNILSNPTITNNKNNTTPKKDHNQNVHSNNSKNNKENNPVQAVYAFPIEPIDASLAEELNAVRQRLERLRLDRERTDKLLQERSRVFDFQLNELVEGGEFQKELEIEVDRLYRLKQLKLACMRRSPIRSLRDKEMEKKNQEAQFEDAKTAEHKEDLADQSSSAESPMMSFESVSASTSASKSNSRSISASCSNSIATPASSSNSTVTSKKSLIPIRLSLERAHLISEIS